MRIAVCDDELRTIDKVKELIEKNSSDDDIYTFTSAEKLLSDTRGFDLIFLDIQMPGLTGIEAARRLKKVRDKARIVFITAAKEYVFEAFDVAAYNYLLKPIDEDKFISVLNRVRNEDVTSNDDIIFIKTRWNSFSIHKKDILYVESQKKKCIIYTLTRQIECYGTMSAFEELLGDDFYRSHRAYLINKSHIISYSTDTVTLTNDNTVYLSKNRYKDFVNAYMEYIKDYKEI